MSALLSRPGFRGALLVTSNEYNTANQLIATRSYAIEQSEQSNNLILSSTLICYNSLGQRTLTVSDMNLNSQIDWSDTDRIVSNDTRYVSLNGDWWRETSSWQTRQNGSSELTFMGRSRTRLTGLASSEPVSHYDVCIDKNGVLILMKKNGEIVEISFP